MPYVNLGFIYGFLGNWEKAMAEDREALLLEPNDEANYGNLGYAYASLNRLDEAEAVYQQAEEHKLEGESLLANRYQLAFLKGDAAHMARIVAAQWESWVRKTCCWPCKRTQRHGTGS